MKAKGIARIAAIVLLLIAMSSVFVIGIRGSSSGGIEDSASDSGGGTSIENTITDIHFEDPEIIF